MVTYGAQSMTGRNTGGADVGVRVYKPSYRCVVFLQRGGEGREGEKGGGGVEGKREREREKS